MKTPSQKIVTEKSVYDFLSYKEYLRFRIEQNRESYGYQTRLSVAAGCQRSFLSQVLNSHVQLTLEHAYSLARFFEMSGSEHAYWFNLVIYERAGTAELRAFQRKQLVTAQEKARNLATRFRQAKISSAEHSARYYGSWLPSAVHILLTVPECREVLPLSKRLGISKDQALSVLRSLEEIGLVEKRGEEWRPTRENIHLPKDSPYTVMNHRNWREVALQESATPSTASVHYTGVYSLSRADAAHLQNHVLAFLDETRKRVIESPEEELAVFLCDFFVLDRS